MKRIIVGLLVALQIFPVYAGDYYTHGGFPAIGASLTSSPFRAEFDSIQAGFNKLPSFAGNGSKFWRINAGATGVEAVSITASSIANTPAGTISSTTIQDAINELATEKVQAGAVTSSGITMSTARLLGRTTASTGAIEEITIGTGLSLSAGALTSSAMLGSNNLSEIVSAATARTNLGLDTASTHPSTDFAASGANTDITSLSAPTLGAATATTQTTGDNSTKVATTAFVGTSIALPAITGTVGSSALTIGLSQMSLSFRSATLGSGAVTILNATPSNLVVPSTATLGTVNATLSRLMVLAINNAGTVELAVVNISGANDLSETGIISTTTIAGGSNSANTVYSTTGRSNVAYRVLGYIESTQATAGTWTTSPSEIQGIGGNAVNSMSSLGHGQTWQSVTRNSGTTYYNTTGKPIMANWDVSTTVHGILAVVINGGSSFNIIDFTSPTGIYQAAGSLLIPVGASYVYTLTNLTTISSFELR